MLRRMARAVVKQGTLTLIDPDRTDTFGEGAPEIAVRLHDRRAIWELALHPDLKLGELYMDGRLTVEEGDIAGLLDLIMTNIAHNRTTGLLRFGRAIRHVLASLRTVQSRFARQGACRPSLRSLRRALRSVPGQGSAIFLRLFLRTR